MRETPEGHLPQGFLDDAAAHLRLPRGALDERDGHLEDACAGLGDAGLFAAGGVLMVLPGFLGDLLGLLCLLPFTRARPRALFARLLLRRLPDRLRGPVRVRATRTAPVGPAGPRRPDAGGSPRVIEGEIV